MPLPERLFTPRQKGYLFENNKNLPEHSDAKPHLNLTLQNEASTPMPQPLDDQPIQFSANTSLPV